MSNRIVLPFALVALTFTVSAGCDDHGHSHDKPAPTQTATSPATSPTTAPAGDHTHGPGGHTHD